MMSDHEKKLELCAYSAAAVATAERFSLTRVELCAAPELDGITPPDDVLREARRCKNIGIHVMIRPRGGDFVYSDDEFETMKSQIVRARELGADGVVFGLLTVDGDVDVVRTRELVEFSRPMVATFHRAFDVARDWRAALEDVIGCGCVRILTSGQAPSAFEGRETLREIVRQAGRRIEIMAGARVNPDNARVLMATGVDALHFSAKNRAGEFADEEFISEICALL